MLPELETKVIFRHWVKLFPVQLKTTSLQLCVNGSYKLAVNLINCFHLFSQEGSSPKLPSERKDMLSEGQRKIGREFKN